MGGHHGQIGVSVQTVRAGEWVPRDGTATATFRVAGEGQVRIGVLTARYNKWEGSMSDYSGAWSYSNYGRVTYSSCQMKSVPRFAAGSEVTVYLSGGWVTFQQKPAGHKKCHVHSFVLPLDCGPISLGVTLGWAQVTIV